MTPTVLDAHALLAYLQGEAGSEIVLDVLVEAATSGSRLLVTSVNVGEVLYTVLREYGPTRLEETEAALDELPLETVPADMPLAREAALLKATRKMSYADCFAAALAKQRGGRVVTGDPEFRAVEDVVEVLWIR